MSYPNTLLHVNGEWRAARSGKTINVINPATEEVIGTVAHAEKADLDEALAAADKGFAVWRKVSAFERYKLMRKAADIFRSRADDIARLLTMEQGKPLAEAKVEVMSAADIIDWFAEEGPSRLWPQIIPARFSGVYAAVGEASCRPGRRFHPLELPDQPGRPQALRSALPPAARSS
jgi:succinate-semialdehyde dehydrogenase/glutarate-semialdehyde dehydrogenase